MNWGKYKVAFVESAITKGLSKRDIETFLDYAKALFDKGLPVIYDIKHLSLLVGYKEDYIHRAIKNTPYFYRSYRIVKKNGGYREISEPLPSLKEIQNWILKEILRKVSVSRFAKAYIKNRSIKSNARFHVNKKIVFTIDIKDFFTSIEEVRVSEIFKNLGYEKNVAEVLAKLCCLDGVLPQGAPTSPYISNLVMKSIDDQISTFTISNSYCYTRYADDLTFSGKLHTSSLYNYVEQVLNKNGFLINVEKTRSRRQHQKQEVTGIIVNEKMQVDKSQRRLFRQAMYYIKKYGFDNHVEKVGISRARYFEHLIGIGNNIVFINPDDVEHKENLEYLKKLYRWG